MNRIKSLKVSCNGRLAGLLAETPDGLAAFEYDDGWLASGFALSPFSLPLRSGVFVPRAEPFGGLFGVFADSLPDGWGRLVVDRMLRRNGAAPQSVTELQRLAIVGAGGMGALTYEPEAEISSAQETDDLDALSAACSELLRSDETSMLDELFRLGGSSGGARPKALMTIDGGEWIVKFPAIADNSNVGEEEYLYSLCARECGVDMPETRLFPSGICPGYFGVRRFDRVPGGTGRVHMISVSAMLETSHRVPNLDYSQLMKLTLKLTKDYEQVGKLFRFMCFNVFAHNRDDHSRNFSFLYDEAVGVWKLSPAYDLTYSYSIGGEHATSVNGNGRDPGMKDVLAVAEFAGLNVKWARDAAAEIQLVTKRMLGDVMRRHG